MSETLKGHGYALIGTYSKAALRFAMPLAIGSAFATTESWETRGLLFGAVALWLTDRVMGVLWAWSPDAEARRKADNEPSTEEVLKATLNGSPLDEAETAELAAVLKRAYDRRQRPPGPKGPVN